MSLDKILGFGSSGAAILSTDDYEHNLQRNMLCPLRSLAQNTQSTVLLIVSNFTPATRTNGTDYKMAVRVTDPTLGAHDTVTWVTFRDLQRMPAIHNIGDIIYLEGVKVQQFQGRDQLLSSYSSRWEIVPADRDACDLHPMFRYLRDWWTRAQKHPEPLVRPQPAATFVTEVVSKYLRQVFELDDSTRYADLLVEVLHVRDSDRSNARRCLVTDYSENKLLHDIVDVPTYPRVTGKRLMWCTINNDIPGMPELSPNHYYRVRSAKVIIDSLEGLSVVVERSDRFPMTKLVNEVHADLPGLKTLLKRRAKCTEATQRLAATMEAEDSGARKTLCIDTTTTTRTPVPVNPPPVVVPPPVAAPDFLDADVTCISEIIGDQQSLGMRYHVRVQIADVHPDSAPESITQESDIRVILEVADDSGSCLVLCQGAAAAEFVGLCPLSTLGDKLTALLPIWDTLSIDEEERPWLDLCVASFLAPGPAEADGRRPLTRCLALAAGSLK
ncbi:hypothetical protein GGI20_002227 [Coemansia sp. BCRC 34301]|nr:hypothetical protein GGI20_002227 [Coemansia sp. BCRC 34301]